MHMAVLFRDTPMGHITGLENNLYGNGSNHTCRIVLIQSDGERKWRKDLRLADFTEGGVTPGYAKPQDTAASKQNYLPQAPVCAPQQPTPYAPVS